MKKFYGILENASGKCHMKFAIENLKRHGKQRSFSAEIFSRDVRIILWNYVLALCHEMTPPGKINQLKQKIIPRINQVSKKSKVYRLAMIIHKSTRLIAENYEQVWAGRLSETVLTGIIIKTKSNVFYWL